MNVDDFSLQGVRALLSRWQQQRQIFTPRFKTGPTNSISDIAGVTVGHSTLSAGEIQTGVTAIVPPGGNLYTHPLPCGAAVLNGFAKPVGLTQLIELGELQTPILLGNTFSVGTLFNAMVRQSCADFPQIGRGSATVNPLVLECNDAFLNDIQAMAITEQHAVAALNSASANFARGSVGAGRGMSCFGLKGGIGTASRHDEKLGTQLGVLVLANFGVLSELTLDGVRVGAEIERVLPELAPQVDAGSIIIIMACDRYLDSRQLTRIARRAGAGLGRLGSYWGHGSGDIAVAFSTHHQGEILADKHAADPYLRDEHLCDEQLEPLLAMAADATEQAVLDAMLAAETVTGFQQHYRLGLAGVLDSLATR